MINLELRVPPPLLFAVAAGGMWLSRAVAEPAIWQRSVAVGLLLLGVVLGVGALLRFRHHQTTVSPTQPTQTRYLVTTGVYRISRNPMYLGLCCWLAAWACYLGGFWVWLGPVLLVGWLTRFQILPEERLLQARFGEEYARYRQRVRRWC